MESQLAKLEKGFIRFKWKGGREVSLACFVEDDEKVEHDQISIFGMGELEKVEVSYNKKVYPLCLECQTHLIKSRMIECPKGSGILEEIYECMNQECPNKVH